MLHDETSQPRKPARCAEEESAQERDLLLALAMQTTKTGWGIWDWRTGASEWSESGKRLMGFESGEEARTAGGWLRRIHPEDRPVVEAHARNVAAEHRNFDIEYRIILPSGEIRWLHGSGRIIYDGKDVPIRSAGFITDITDRKQAEEALRERESWLAGQREALESALAGAPLETSLGMLVRTATGRLGQDTRAAFYVANSDGKTLHHVVGMPAAYAEAVDGFKIGPESLACGLATHTGRPVLTADVRQDPLWAPWLGMAEKFDYRGCWSFPVHTAAGKFVGTFAVYSRQPRAATRADIEFAGLVTQTAAIIIARHTDGEVRRLAEEALRASEEKHRAQLEEQVASRTSELQIRLAERDALLKEVHHRVKNNLHVITSVLEMQARRVSDASVAAQLEEACNRVMSIASIHESLYRRESFATADFRDYARELAERLIGFYGLESRVTAKIAGSGFSLELARAVPCALLLNELVSNSCKHAFPGDRPGEICITLSQEGRTLRLQVADDGIGLPPDFDTGMQRSLGRKIVDTLGAQLGGVAAWRSGPGASVEIVFQTQFSSEKGSLQMTVNAGSPFSADPVLAE